MEEGKRQAEPVTQRHGAALIALGVLSGLLLVHGLGRLPLIGPDEPRYADIARAMVATGDLITPRLAGLEWFEKPALTYWLAAVGYRLLGVSEFAARIGIVLWSVVGILAVYGMTTRLRSASYGYLSASVLVSCAIWVGFSRVATFDLPLAVSFTLALLCYLGWEQSGGIRWWAGLGVSLGLALLAKGLVGLLLPGGIILVYALLTGQWRPLLHPGRLLLGSGLMLAVASLWYGPMLARHGQHFIDEFFIAHHFQRYLTNQYRHPQPVYFFAVIGLVGCFPWNFPLLARLFGLGRRWRELRAREGRFELFLWLWALAPIVFFSFSGSKLPGYILPAFPALLMLAALQLEEWEAEATPSRGQVGSVLATTVVLFLLGVGVALAGPGLLGLDKFTAYRLAAIGVLVAIVYLMIWFLLHLRAANRFLPFGFGVVMVAVVNLVTPVLAERETLKALGEQAVREARPGERLVFFLNSNHRLNFYATDLPLRDEKSYFVIAPSLESIPPLIERHGGESLLLLSQRQWSGALVESPLLRMERLGEQRGPIKCSPNCDLVLFRARAARPGDR